MKLNIKTILYVITFLLAGGALLQVSSPQFLRALMIQKIAFCGEPGV